MLRKSLLILLLSTVSLCAWAQNGSISGIVTDGTTGEAIIGANVVIDGTQVGAATDIDGKFSIPNVKPGSYSLNVTFITYKLHKLNDVIVEGGKVTEIQVGLLADDATTLNEVVVAGVREINNDVALISTIRASKLVVTGISAEQIIKLPDNDAAQVMKRVPGITIVDNRFVMVRGIPERYNQVMINDAIAPSTEVDKRSFSFDLIPAGALDQLLIYKSGTPELPGDFAGGVIQIVTKQTTTDEYLSFGVNFGFLDNTTFQPFNESKKSSSDIFGFDNGDRGLPSDFPSTSALQNSPTVSSIREAAGKSLENNFGYSTSDAPVNYGFNIGFARNFSLGKVRASSLNILGYSNSYARAAGNFERYSTFDKDPSTPSIAQMDFNDVNFWHERKINLVSNWRFNLNDRNNIEFKNLLVQIGENKTMLRSGTDNGGQQGLYNNFGYHYLARTIYSSQLQSTFRSVDKSSTLKVLFGLNYVNRDEPDFRRFRTLYKEDEGKFQVILPPSANPFDAGRFYSTLEDINYSHGLGWEKKFGTEEEKRRPTFKTGYLVDYKTRTFNARYISYLYPGNFDGAYGQQLSYLPFNQIFSPENLYTTSPDGSVQQEGLAIQEGTRPTDSYKGNSLVAAGYVSGAIPVGKFDISGGARVEQFHMELTSYNGDSTFTRNVTSVLPSINISYNLSDRSLIRLAYSKTVNRPEFREIAPFLFYQFEYNLNIAGQSKLKTATIDNIDLRWEMYPNPGEFVSFGGFYKHFKDPIEFVQVNASGNLQFGYQNAPEAYSLGVELEVRKSLSSLAVSKFLRNLSVNLNASLIKSEVDMGEGITFQERRRPLQGQSPYVINTGVYYADTETGLSVNAAYNIFGNRIFSVGSVLFPTWLERPRNSMDLQIAKTFKSKFELKLNVTNVLNSRYRLYQDNDENQKIDEKIDDPIQTYKNGTLYTVSATWKISKD